MRERIASLSLVPFPDQVLSLDAVPLPEEAALHQCGVQEGSSLVLTAIASADAFLQQLEELLKDGISVDELALLYCYKHGVSAAQTLQALGLGNKLQDFLSSHGFPLQGNAVYARVASEISQPTSAASRLPEDNQKYLDLHNSLCSRAFNSKVAKALAEHLEELTQLLRALPLDIARVVPGGSMGKGTGAGVCPADAEVVFFINTFAPEAQWLHQLLPAVAALLSQRLKGVTLAQDAVLLSSSPPVPRLELRFAAERSYRQAKAMAKHDPQAWRWQTSFVEQRVRFVARQPGSVKVANLLEEALGSAQSLVADEEVRREVEAKTFPPAQEVCKAKAIAASTLPPPNWKPTLKASQSEPRTTSAQDTEEVKAKELERKKEKKEEKRERRRAAEERSGKGRFVESSEERPNSRDRQAPNPGGLKKKKKNKGRVERAEDKDGWQVLGCIDEGEIAMGSCIHATGEYRKEACEIIARVDGYVSDTAGRWLKLSLCGTPCEGLRSFVLTRAEEQDQAIFMSRTAVDLGNQENLLELFYVDEGEEVAQKMGFEEKGHGLVKAGAGAVEKPFDVADEELSKEQKKKQRRAREKAAKRDMEKKAQWSWKGTVLDPTIKPPCVKVKKKSTQKASSSLSSTSSEEGSLEEIFEESNKIRQMAKKVPGMLSRHTLSECKSILAQGVGEASSSIVGPGCMVKYYRQEIQPGPGPKPMKREWLTVASAVDALVGGAPLKALDILCQQAKSLEAMARGASPEVALQLEVPLTELAGLASATEAKSARGEDVMILSSSDEDSAKLSAPLPCVGQAGEVATGRGETCFPLPVSPRHVKPGPSWLSMR
ncbi:unnamed protein product [Effrenium voratum]|nr:unnamed protein product [Effrenium voratum]